MLPLERLAKIHGIARTRKCALLLEKVELDLAELGQGRQSSQMAIADDSAAANLKAYAMGIAGFLSEASDTPPEVVAAARLCLESAGESGDSPCAFRAIDDFRHVLMRVSGQAPADWDLHDFRAPQPDVASEHAAGKATRRVLERPFSPGIRVYLEDIRSPFNVGTIMRTAEAFGFEEVLLSPGCADPRHPRAARSSMGAVDMIPWRRAPLAEIQPLGPLFALELGGVPLSEFPFPKRGILILGSEELGVSEGALRLAAERRLSIPMRGIKASLNVAVAFGIAAQAWVSGN